MADVPCFELTWIFDVPRAAVWRGWTDLDRLKAWSGPAGCETRFHEYQLEVGGVCHYSMHFGDAPPMYGRYGYQSIEAPQRLSWHQSFSNEAGDVVRHPMEPNWPLVMLTELSFEASDSQCAMTLRWTPVDASPRELEVFAANLEGVRGAWEGSIAELERVVADGYAIETGALRLFKVRGTGLRAVRSFAAPQHAVFRAFTDAAVIRHWMLGPGEQWTLPVCRVDLREGGEGRFEWAGSAGETMGVSFTYDTVRVPSHTVHREVFDEDWTGGETRVDTVFAEEEGGTLVDMWIDYSSTEARDRVFGEAFAQGLEGGYQKLDALLSES